MLLRGMLRAGRAIYVSVIKRLLTRSRRGLIFAAHGVSSGKVEKPMEQVHMTAREFIAIVDLLQDLDFDFLSMDQIAVLSKSGFAHKRHWTHLSFDDGYQNIDADILPYLEQRGIPFSVFVSTHHIESGQRFPTFIARYAYSLGKDLSRIFDVKNISTADEAESLLKFSSAKEHEERLRKIYDLLTEDEIRASERFKNEQPLDLTSLKRISRMRGGHVGSHMHHHWLFHVDQQASLMREDLETSLRRLKWDWGVSADPAFCYPNGNYDQTSLSFLRESGIKVAFTYQSGFVDKSTHPLLIRYCWWAPPKPT